MPKSKTTKLKKFTFQNVYPYASMSSLWIALPCLTFYAVAYFYLFGDGFRLSLVGLTFLLYFATTTMIVRLFSKDVTVWFDEQNMYLQFQQKQPKCYAKQQIIGFYSYDYSTKSPLLFNSKISIVFSLKTGEKLYFNDSVYRNLVDEDKRLLLSKFLKKAQIELGFSAVRRQYKYYANNVDWYAKQNKAD